MGWSRCGLPGCAMTGERTLMVRSLAEYTSTIALAP